MPHLDCQWCVKAFRPRRAAAVWGRVAKIARFAALAAIFAYGGATGLSSGARAEPLPPPAGEIVLTVTGKISNTNPEGAANFDRAMLEGIGLWTIETTTPWTDGRQSYVGVLSRDLLLAVGARGQRVTARGLNDYIVDIPISDFLKYPVIFAFKVDDRYMRVRDKGPVLIVYPRDKFDELKSPRYSSKWVWQLRELDIK